MVWNSRSAVRLVCAVLTFLTGSATVGARSGEAQTGGFVETAASTTYRAPLAAAEIAALLPSRGRFTFPAPYWTTGVRLTNATDCAGADCVNPVGYSYWRNINNHTGSDTMLIFLTLARERGGNGPTLFIYNKATGETRNAGTLFDESSRFSWATGEGWYFSATRPASLYMNDGPRLLRYDVVARTFETIFDVQQALGRSDVYIWQMHSSDDDRVHSATVKDSATYRALGCVAHSAGFGAKFFTAIGEFDECQIDKSGRWLVIKDNIDGRYGEDNRIVDLQTGAEQVLYDEQGATGHSDLGYGYMVGEDNFATKPGAARLWRFGSDLTAAGQGKLVYHLTSWDTGLGHITHGNARPDVAIEQQIVCSSQATRQPVPRANEIVCYRLDGSLDVLVVAPNLTDLNATGGGSDDYSKLPKGNLDVTGEYFIWTSNAGGGRLDAFVVHVPRAKLVVTTDPTEPTGGSGTEWASLVNVTLTGGTLQKTAGCDGCPDASAVSAAEIGDGGLNWTVPEVQTLRVVGLSSGGAGTAPEQLPFAIRLQAGIAEVREYGVYRSDVLFSAGDRFAISTENGVLRYAKNGTVFYTSGSAATTSMRSHLIFYGLNGTIADVTLTTAAAPAMAPSLTLDATGYKVKGRQKADLRWNGGSAGPIDVYRDGAVIATVENNGAYTDHINGTGGGSHTYSVCEAGTATCSAQVRVTF